MGEGDRLTTHVLRYWPLLAILAVGAVLTSLATFLAAKSDHVARAREFDARAADASAAVITAFSVPAEVALTLPAFIGSHRDLDADTFHQFTTPTVRRHPSIAALEWLPRVTHAERAQFEASTGLTFVEPANGGFTPASTRPYYFPIQYINPHTPGVVGLDIGFEAGRAALIDQAVSSGKALLSSRFKLVEDTPDVYSIAMYVPVFRDKPTGRSLKHDDLRGLSVALFRLKPVVSEALVGIKLEGLQFVLEDLTAPEPERVLATGGESLESATETASYSRSWNYLDRTWRIVWQGDLNRLNTRGTALFFALGGGGVTLVAMAVYVAGERLKSLHQQITFARTLGSYTLVKKLGEGGMGSVYLAKHALLRRPTAVKVIRAERATEELRSRFEREVQCTSRLTHPNTISVFDYGHSSDGRFYYAMEYIDGLSLEAVVRSFGAFPSDRAIHVLEQVCGAVAEAHSHDIVHRDLKPENIMLCCRGGVPDFVKVLDFGLAKTFESVGSDLSQTGGLIGTPGYMAPEAVTSGSANARTDVFSLGAVLYFLIAGKPAFHAPTAMGMLTLATSGPPPPPSERLGRSVDPQLESLLMSCLAADPQVRPPDAASLLEHLQRLNRGTWTTARAHAWWQENGAEAQARAERDAPATGSGATLAVDMSGSSRQQAS